MHFVNYIMFIVMRGVFNTFVLFLTALWIYILYLLRSKQKHSRLRSDFPHTHDLFIEAFSLYARSCDLAELGGIPILNVEMSKGLSFPDIYFVAVHQFD